MNLKESFEYMNYLKKMLTKANGLLDISSVVTETKEMHMRKKVNPEAEDEEIKVISAYLEEEININHLIELNSLILNEIETLSDAIYTAKKNAPIDIDKEIFMNTIRRRTAQIYKKMSSIKNSEKMTTARGTKFNNEGNEVGYTYPVKVITTINFDRNEVKKKAKKYLEKCDKKSKDIDEAQITIQVNHTPCWSVHNTIYDLLEKVAELESKQDN